MFLSPLIFQVFDMILMYSSCPRRVLESSPDTRLVDPDPSEMSLSDQSRFSNLANYFGIQRNISSESTFNVYQQPLASDHEQKC